MSQELHYTSVPRGLLPGTRGFCTVACTPNMSGPLRERLESLSGYQQVFPPHDPRVGLNPVVFSHHRLSLGGRSYSVLSRVCFSGLDYTSRSNKYAHHVVLDPAERPTGGPAWLLIQPGFMEHSWRGEPGFLSAGRVPPQGDHPGGVAHAWQALTGDAGWAGVLAESFLTDPQRPVVLIFEPGMDLLSLFVEALALLPASRRWDVDFSTYFTHLPQGLGCAWRGVVAGSAEAKHAIRLPNVLLVQLDKPAARASGTDLVHLARTGQRLQRSADEVKSQRGPVASKSRTSASTDRGPGISPSADFLSLTDAPAQYDVLPRLHDQETALTGIEAHLGPRTSSRSVRGRRMRLLSILAASLFLLVLIAVAWRWLASGTKGGALVAEASKAVAGLKVKHASTSTGEPRAQGGVAGKSVVEKDLEARKPNDLPKPDEKLASTDPPHPDIPKREEPKPAETAGQSDKKPLALPKQSIDYWELPMIPSPLFDLSATQANSGRSPEKKIGEKVEYMDFVSWADDVSAKSSGDLIRLSIPAGFGGSMPLAEISCKDRVLTFAWGESLRETRFSRLIEDSALIVHAPAGNTCTIFFRNLGVKSQDPLTITATPQDLKGRDSRSKRSTRIPWCDPKSIQGSKWSFLIRRWQLECEGTKGSKPEIIAEGPGGSNPISHEILPEGRASVTLEIPKDGPHEIKLNMSLDYDRWISETQRLDRIENDIKGLEKLGANIEKQDRKELDSLRDERGILKPFVDKFNYIYKSQVASLRITIGVRIGNHDLDIARFGAITDRSR